MELLSEEKLKEFLPDHNVEQPSKVSDIAEGKEYVYILTVDNQAIVVGRGKKNRAKVIFDTPQTLPTQTHIKSILVRLYHLYGDENFVFKRYLISCDPKEKAKEIEKEIHDNFGGNITSLPESIEKKLFEGLKGDVLMDFVLKAALLSSYSGISDLRKWKRAGLIDDQMWGVICSKLNIS